MPLTYKVHGDFHKAFGFLEKIKEKVRLGDLDSYGQAGVEALKQNTPKRTGLTADSWYYEIERENGIAKIVFKNSNIQNGTMIAIVLQYGHGTRNGGWVEGVDYINPSLQPIFQKIADDAWEEVRKTK